MARQVRIDDDLADWLGQRYPDHSLSAAACAALLELRERKPATSSAPAEVARPTGSVSIEHDETTRADVARERAARAAPGRCPHPLENRVGTRCGDCGRAVHGGPRAR